MTKPQYHPLSWRTPATDGSSPAQVDCMYTLAVTFFDIWHLHWWAPACCPTVTLCHQAPPTVRRPFKDAAAVAHFQRLFFREEDGGGGSLFFRANVLNMK